MRLSASLRAVCNRGARHTFAGGQYRKPDELKLDDDVWLAKATQKASFLVFDEKQQLLLRDGRPAWKAYEELLDLTDSSATILLGRDPSWSGSSDDGWRFAIDGSTPRAECSVLRLAQPGNHRRPGCG